MVVATKHTACRWFASCCNQASQKTHLHLQHLPRAAHVLLCVVCTSMPPGITNGRWLPERCVGTVVGQTCTAGEVMDRPNPTTVAASHNFGSILQYMQSYCDVRAASYRRCISCIEVWCTVNSQCFKTSLHHKQFFYYVTLWFLMLVRCNVQSVHGLVSPTRAAQQHLAGVKPSAAQACSPVFAETVFYYQTSLSCFAECNTGYAPAPVATCTAEGWDVAMACLQGG